MRVTTWILREHLGSDSIALLAESYLMGNGEVPAGRWWKKSNRGYVSEKSWHDIGRGGHMEMIMHRLKKDKKEKIKECRFKSVDVVNGICASGDIDIIKMVTNLVNKQYFIDGLASFLEAVYDEDAIERDDCLDVAKLLISLGSDAKNPKLMKTAARNWDVDMCHLLIRNGNPERDEVFRYAGVYGDVDLLEIVLPPKIVSEYDLMLSMVCVYDKLDFVKKILPQQLQDANPLLIQHIATRMISFAVANDNLEIADFLLSRGANPYIGFSEMCRHGKNKSFDMLVKAGATSCACGLAINAHTLAYSKKRKANYDAEMNAKWKAKYPHVPRIVESDNESDD